MDFRERLAVNMKRLRKERGWSQEALADAAGLDRTYISGIERVVKNPTVTVIERVAPPDVTVSVLPDCPIPKLSLPPVPRRLIESWPSPASKTSLLSLPPRQMS